MVNLENAKRAIRDKLKLHSYYRDTFADPNNHAGQVVLRHICKVGDVGGTPYVAGDAYQTAFNAGKQYLALCILRYANRDVADLIRQLEQNVEPESL